MKFFTKIGLLFAVMALILGVQFVHSPAAQAIDDPLKQSCDITSDKNSQFCQNAGGSGKSIIPENAGDDSLLMTVAQTIVFITAAISVVMIVIGGFKYVSSNGDSNGIKSAKDTIQYALIGLFIAISAQIIVSLVLSKLVN
jgi:hypothetical protein